MLELSTTQIAARLGISERTAQRWIASERIQVTPTRRGNKWQVEESELERLAKVSPDEVAELRADLDQLQARVLELEREVASLRDQIGPSAPTNSTRHTSSPATRSSTRTPGAHTTVPVPDGTVTARSFAQAHGLTRDMMEGWIKRGEVETTQTPLGNRVQHVLTPEQQGKVIAFWKANSIPYQQCLQCPHASSPGEL